MVASLTRPDPQSLSQSESDTSSMVAATKDPHAPAHQWQTPAELLFAGGSGVAHAFHTLQFLMPSLENRNFGVDQLINNNFNRLIITDE